MLLNCACPGTQERLGCYLSVYAKKKIHDMRALNPTDEITRYSLLPSEVCGCVSKQKRGGRED